MNPQQPAPKITLTHTADYREHYANSVQVRVSLWDFFLLFGLINQTAADSVTSQNFQGLYLSPQQPAPKITLTHTADYREHYANSVQVRVSLWDFFLLFGLINQT